MFCSLSSEPISPLGRFLVGSAHALMVDLKQLCGEQAGNKTTRRWSPTRLNSAPLWAGSELRPEWWKKAAHWQCIGKWANGDSFGIVCVCVLTCSGFKTTLKVKVLYLVHVQSHCNVDPLINIKKTNRSCHISIDQLTNQVICFTGWCKEASSDLCLQHCK